MRRLLYITTIFSVLFAQTYQSEIQPIWDNSCTSSCHISSSINGGLNLSPSTSYSELVNVASQGWPAIMRVRPGDSMNSVLHQKIVGNSKGERMPKGGANLSQANIEKITKWIDEGALQNWSGGASSSYSFDFGPGGKIEVDSPINNQPNWSIESWVKFHQTPSAGSWYSLFIINDGTTNYFELSCDGNSTNFNVVLNGSQIISDIAASGVFDNQFHHFFVEGDGSKVSFYIDGEKKGEIAYTANFQSPASVKMEIGNGLDGSMDEIRIRNISGFDGVPTQRYVAQNGVELLYQFDDQNTTTITDNSGKGHNGNIVGQATYEGDVYGGGGMTEGIDVSFKSNEIFGGKVRIGYVPQGNDPNYWTSVTHKWPLADHSFPGDYTAKVWNSDINDGEAHLIVFVDSNKDDQWDNATEYGAISQVFQVTNKQGNAGTLTLMKGGGGGGTSNTIEIVVKLNQNIGNGDVHVGVWYPGSISAPDLVDNLDNQGTPSPAQGWNFQLSGSGIVPSGGPYKVEAFFDQNNNDMPDGGEFIVNLDNIYTDSQGYAYTDIDLGGGGGGGGTQVQVQIKIQKEYAPGDLHLWVNKEGEDPYAGQSVWGATENNVDPPYDQLKTFTIEGMLAENQYYIVGHFDANNDQTLDTYDEPFGVSELFSLPPSGSVTLVINEKIYTDSVEVVIKSIAPDIGNGDLWLALYENEDTNPIDALPGIPDNPIFSERILDFGQTPIINAIYAIKPENLDAKYDSAYAWIAYYYTHGADGDYFDVNSDLYDWGYIDVNRQSIEQGNRLKLELQLHYIEGPSIGPPSVSSIQANYNTDLQLVFGTNASSLTGSEVDYAGITYWHGTGSGIDERFADAVSTGDGTWTATIPGSNVTMGGLVVEYSATDKIGKISGTPLYDIQVAFGDLPEPSLFASTNSGTYQMVSVPAVLQNSSISGVIEDELGANDPKKWRIFRWSNGAYQENSGSFIPGSAFWLITKNEEQINTGPGKSTPIFSPTKLNLSNGWNMVGNPYYYQVNLAEHVVFSENVESTLYQWNGSSYNNTTNMVPRGGNWVFSNGSGTMEFFPMWKPQLQSEAIPEGTVNDEEDFSWKAKLITKAGNYYDETATFGVHESASDTWDQFDYHEPPVIGDYISMAFDNDSWANNGGRYSQDIRSKSRTQTWNLAARSNIKGIVSLSLEDINAIPSHQDIRLVDPVLGIVYNLRSEKAVTFISQGNENSYHFKLIVGEADDIQSQLDDMGMVPNDFELAQNTPNPFNPVTNIRVSLVEEAKVTLKVYNLLGEEMNTLVLNRSLGKGNHRFIWAGKDDNGNQLPSGVYLYRMEVNSLQGQRLYQSTKKMILMK
jgi:hypothetical protein